MFRSLHAAEQAAINGENQEWDTQQCEALKQELLPSSPASEYAPTTQVASTNLRIANSTYTPSNIEQSPGEGQSEGDNTGSRDAADDEEDKADIEKPLPSLELNQQPAPAARTRSQPRILYRRDSHGKIRAFTIDGEERRMTEDFSQRYQTERDRLRAMDDLTQKSSMSLTQENPSWVNDQFDLQRMIAQDCPSIATPDEDDEDQPADHGAHDSNKHTSARTQSTAYTYEETDTGHITLDFNPEPESDHINGEMEESESQDASYAGPGPEFQSHHQSFGNSFEPKTPAPPINPFLQKGSVMKGHEMFGATQPSSIGRHMASPTSSRPSPDVYNNFSSPPKHQMPFTSSPLVGRMPGLALEPESEANENENENETTPLQSSVRNLLARSQSFRNSRTTQSFDAGPRKFANLEPRPYVSMKESQERRQSSTAREDSDSSDGDSDIGARPRRKKEREMQIRREIAAVGIHKRMSSTPRSSVPLSSSTPVTVEVPSTGQRRSIQKEYVAQSSGFDARDTQQDDVIADSQAATASQGQGLPRNEVGLSKAPSPEHDSTPKELDSPKLQPLQSNNSKSLSRSNTPGLDEDTEDEDEDAAADAAPTLNNSSENVLQPSLPLQELSSNRNDSRTPNSKERIYSDTVPETSPSEDRVRPMGEIASISFNQRDDLDDLPGFTQDLDFDAAMKIRSSPKPSPLRTPSLIRNTSILSASTAALNSCGPPMTSSALSSLPSSVVEPRTLDDPAEEGESSGRSEPAGAEEETTNGEQARGHRTEEQPASVDQAYETAREDPTVEDAASIPQPDLQPDLQPELVENQVIYGEGKEQEHPSDPPQEPAAPPVAKRGGLRTNSKLKGPSRNLRRSQSNTVIPSPNQITAPLQSPQTLEVVATAQRKSATPQITPHLTPSAPHTVTAPRSTRNLTLRSEGQQNATLDVASTVAQLLAPVPITSKRTTKRKSAAAAVEDAVLPTRSSKRQSIVKDSSPDPLALSSPTLAGRSRKSPSGLFEKMTFAVSYVGNEREKNEVIKMILENSGRILPDGFDSLFTHGSAGEDIELSLSPSAKSVGFTALIADEHSRKAKYMQALALGLPCISGHWITACVSKSSIIDWSRYLLCAGQSSILGNAHKSRVLQPYPAAEATLEDVFAKRDKLLEGKSVLFITGKGKTQDKRKAYSFLARALGPARIGQVVDYQEARKKLSQGEQQEQEWDMVYVDTNEKLAETAVFGKPASAASSIASRKRKRGPTPAVVDDSPAPKKIRIISDETMIQSLILGQLLDD